MKGILMTTDSRSTGQRTADPVPSDHPTTTSTLPHDAPAFGPLGLDHVSLRVPDYAASMDWYRTVLGLPVLVEWTEPQWEGMRFAHLQLGAAKLEIIGGGHPSARPTAATVAEHMHPEGVIHLCLTVPDLHPAIARLRAHGVELMAGPLFVEPLDITLVIVQDNAGNVLEISQRGHLPDAA